MRQIGMKRKRSEAIYPTVLVGPRFRFCEKLMNGIRAVERLRWSDCGGNRLWRHFWLPAFFENITAFGQVGREVYRCSGSSSNSRGHSICWQKASTCASEGVVKDANLPGSSHFKELAFSEKLKSFPEFL